MAEQHARSRRWFRPPVLRTVENDGHERKTSWLELFYDLVLVVGIAKLAHLYSHHPGWHGALVVAGLYCAVFIAWQGFSFYADRFDTDDLTFRLATYAQMLCVIALSMQIDAVADGHVEGFALAFGTQRTILVLLYARAYRHSVKARPLARRYGGIYGFGAALWLASAALPMPWSIVLWGVAIANDLGAPPTSTGLHREAPTDPAHVPERLALFTLIVLGELVVTVGIAADGSQWNPAQIATAIGVFGISICLWWEYFERLGGHELPHSGARIVTFAYAHLVLLGGLLFVASGAQVVIGAKEEDLAAGMWALCAGSSVFLAGLNIAHAQLVVTPLRKITIARWVAVVALPLVAAFSPGALAGVGAAFVVLAILVAYESANCAPES